MKRAEMPIEFHIPRRIIQIAAAAVLLSTGSAQAQFFYRPPVVAEELTPREAHYAVARYGYRPAGRVSYQDDVVVVPAVAPDGRRFRIVLDVYSGQILNSTPLASIHPQRDLKKREVRRAPQQPRERVVQRVPDQGPAIRQGVPNPETRAKVSPDTPRATPENPTVIRRQPMLPPQNQPVVRQPTPDAAPKAPPEAAVGSGTRQQPRRIDGLPPPAALDAPRSTTPEAPINSVPPAGLD
jgi:hypothetical protein